MDAIKFHQPIQKQLSVVCQVNELHSYEAPCAREVFRTRIRDFDVLQSDLLQIDIPFDLQSMDVMSRKAVLIPQEVFAIDQYLVAMAPDYHRCPERGTPLEGHVGGPLFSAPAPVLHRVAYDHWAFVKSRVEVQRNIAVGAH